MPLPANFLGHHACRTFVGPRGGEEGWVDLESALLGLWRRLERARSCRRGWGEMLVRCSSLAFFPRMKFVLIGFSLNPLMS